MSTKTFTAIVNRANLHMKDAPLRDSKGNKLLMEIQMVFEKEDFELVSIQKLTSKPEETKEFKIQVQTGRDYSIMDFISKFHEHFDFIEVSVKWVS